MKFFIIFFPKLLPFLITGLLMSCNYSITMVHTEGQASDVVDETDTMSTDVSPTLSIPASAL